MRSIAPSLFFSGGLVSAVLVSDFAANRLEKKLVGFAVVCGAVEPVSAIAICGGETSPLGCAVGAAPATAGASASSGMRGGRTVAGIVPGGVEARNAFE